jgi:hypothetical protein
VQLRADRAYLSGEIRHIRIQRKSVSPAPPISPEQAANWDEFLDDFVSDPDTAERIKAKSLRNNRPVTVKRTIVFHYIE